MNEQRKLSFKLREGTTDRFTYREVCERGEYSDLQIATTDVVLDIGANIGCFSIMAAQKAKTVIAYEPDEENYAMLLENIKLNNAKNIIAINACVVGNHDKTRTFFINSGTNKARHSLFPMKTGYVGRATECENINNIIEKYTPTIIKMDTEGAEYEIISGMTANALSKINMMAFEYHKDIIGDDAQGTKLSELLANPSLNGFNADKWNPKKASNRIKAHLLAVANRAIHAVPDKYYPYLTGLYFWLDVVPNAIITLERTEGKP